MQEAVNGLRPTEPRRFDEPILRVPFVVDEQSNGRPQ